MKRPAAAIFLLLITISLCSQTLMVDSVFTGSQHLLQPGKFNYGLNLGSEFASIKGFGSEITTQVSPHFSYNVSKRFSVGIGIGMGTTHYINARSWFQNEQPAASNGSFTTGSIYVSGQYLVSDRITLSGSAFKIFPVTKDPLPFNPFNPVSRNGAQGANLNIDYKISDHFHIQANFRYSQGLSPFNLHSGYNDPFQPGSLVPGFSNNNSGW
ncbi:MAG: hypothetical protein WCK34_15295 [Bacteroidota bacterium]